MNPSYVAVGTAMYMITDSLTYRSQENPRRSEAPLLYAQRFDRKPRLPQIGECHGDRRLGEG